MKVSTIRAVKVAGLVGLPLIALLAVALFFTLGNSNTDTAEAAAGTGMTISIAGSVTDPVTGKVSVTTEVSQKFTVTISADSLPAVPINGFAAEIITSSASLKYNGGGGGGACNSEVKLTQVGGAANATCQSFTTGAGGHGLAVISNFDGVTALDTSGAVAGFLALANLTYTCNSVGNHSVTLTLNPASPDGAAYSDLGFALLTVKANANGQSINVTCLPEPGTISIAKTDFDTGAALGGTCWEVSSIDLSDPSAVQQVVDVVGDNQKACANTTGNVGADKSAVEGTIDITISGALRLSNGDDWLVRETQAPAKYDGDFVTKNNCDFGESTTCNVAVTNTLNTATINATFEDKVSGLGADPVQCIDLTGANNITICDNDANDKDGDLGVIEANIGFGSTTVTLGAGSIPDGRILAAATPEVQACDVPDSANAKCTVAYSYIAAVPQWLKILESSVSGHGGVLDPETGIRGPLTTSTGKCDLSDPEADCSLANLANLFLTAQGAKLGATTCEAGTDVVTFQEVLSRDISSGDPKGSGNPQVIAGFEVEVRFDAKLVCVNILPAFAADDEIPPAGGFFCVTKQLDGIASIHCASKDGGGLPIVDNKLALVEVRPQPDLYSFIIANQVNGVIAQIIDQGCKLTDELGHPIPILSCEDADVTIRFLEGDVNADCRVDALDQQQLAFRWGSSLGNLLYGARYDLEPSANFGGGNLNGDGDIDINDLQFVFGRHLSSCAGPEPSYQADPGNPKIP